MGHQVDLVCYGGYLQAAKDVAKELNVKLIDL
jgi:hypothetical protein